MFDISTLEVGDVVHLNVDGCIERVLIIGFYKQRETTFFTTKYHTKNQVIREHEYTANNLRIDISLFNGWIKKPLAGLELI